MRKVDRIVPSNDPSLSQIGEPMADASPSQSKHSSLLKTLICLAIVPTIILVGLLWRAPNYQSPDPDTQQPLAYPLGGDFLQEYVGGLLVRDQSSREQLYEPETFQSAQHDPAKIGFTWGQDQFFPAVYPPFWYAAVSPLSKCSYLTAARLWLVLMTVALVAATWLLHRFANVPVPLLMVLCLASPVIESLNAGQKGSVLLLILSATYVLWKRQRQFLSGLVFSLIAFKPHLGIAIGLWMLVIGNWRWVAGTFSGLAALVIASFLISPDLVKEYLNVVFGFGDYVQSGGYNLHESFSIWSFWQLLVGHPLAAKVLTIVSSLIVLGVSLKKVHQWRTANLIGLDQAFAAMVIVMIVTSPHLYTYDLTMLLLPIGLLMRTALGSQADTKDPLVWMPVGLLVALMFASGTVTSLAATTGIQIGVPVLLAVWIAIMRSSFVEPAQAS